MIIYFADRNLNITDLASTSLQGGFRVYNDKTTEYIDTGVNTFSCEISCTDDTRTDLESAVDVGQFLLKQSGGGMYSSENIYDSLYQIIDTEYNAKERKLYIYAEDAGLDLINKMCSKATLTNMTMLQMLQYFAPSDWVLNIIDAPAGTKTYTWEGSSTCTQRLDSVANLFDCELYYSFEIQRLQVISKIINVVRKRGNQTATAQLRLNLDIDNIITSKSIADLATAYEVTGGIPENSETPIDLKGYAYEYTDEETGDVYRVDTATGQMRNINAMQRWSSALDADGLIVKEFQFDTTDKAVLAGQARASLQKASYAYVNYEVDFAILPEDIEIGDRVNIIDEDGELYLEARLLSIETSAANDKQKATIGEFLLKDSGISDKVAALAAQFANYAGRKMYSISIESTAGDVFIDTLVDTVLIAHVYLNGKEQSDEQIAEVGVIKWYDYDNPEVVLGTGSTYTITAEDEVVAMNITARLEADE